MMAISASAAIFQNSEINYAGASATSPFTIINPYTINIQGVSTRITNFGGINHINDYSGVKPFVNASTGCCEPQGLQGWNHATGVAQDLGGGDITNAGLSGSVEKASFGTDTTTLTRYLTGDGLTGGYPRSKVYSYAIPPRTHVRWEFEVAFGNADGANDWDLTTTGASPITFWQVKSANQGNATMHADVDTDSNDATKLMLTFYESIGTKTQTNIGRIHGIARHTMIPITVEAFLDERAIARGGKGALSAWVNSTLVADYTGPTLSLGTNTHDWEILTYLWNERAPYAHTRAEFWKTAQMFVYPIDIAPPTAP